MASAFYYRQVASQSVTGYHQTSQNNQEIVIELNGVGTSADNQLHLASTLSTIDYSIISKLVQEKNFGELTRLGGVERIGTSLQTDLKCGISGDPEEISRRTNAFGTNSCDKPPSKSFFYFVLEQYREIINVILLVCAGLLFGLDINEEGLRDGWYNGGSIFLAVSLVIFVNAICNFWLEKIFAELAKTRNNMVVDVLRDSKRQRISKFQIVVGDVVVLKIGDQVPADGLLIDGFSLQVDESRLTGDSNFVEVNQGQNPFFLSGSTLVDGYATMLVTCVGTSTEWGELNEQTPLHERMHILATLIGMVGLTVATTILVVLCARYFTGHTKNGDGRIQYIPGKSKANHAIKAMVGIITGVVSIVVIGVPEGLASMVSHTLARLTKRMQGNQAEVRNLSACLEMALITTICADMSSTLVSNQMDVTKSFISNVSMEEKSYTSIRADIFQLFVQAVGLTVNIARRCFAVTPVDDAIHKWALSKLDIEMEKSTEGLSVLRVEASCPGQKRMGVLVKRQSENIFHVHWRGDFEEILSLCSHYYDAMGTTVVLCDQERQRFSQMMKNTGLRRIAFAHKHLSEEKNGNEEIPNRNLIFLGAIGLKSFCCPGTKQAVEMCQQAGIEVKIITSQSVSEAKAIALECGILSPIDVGNEGTIVTGEEFRSYPEKAQMENVDKIKIVARSCPLDKLLMVQRLKERGNVVAVTGGGINCAPAFKEADVGLSMGIQGTQMGKENSDIIILDDRFASVATAVRWGRSVYNIIQRCIQFYLAMIFAALAINLVAAMSTGETMLTPAQLLWVNLIADLMGALALSTEKPRQQLMRGPPVSRDAPLITNIMWGNLIFQASFQIVVILALKFKGKTLSGLGENVVDTLIFATFVLLQVFNLFNCRVLEEKNVFRGILQDKFFLGIIVITIVVQVIIVEFLGKIAHTERLDWKLWGGSLGIAALSWPFGWLVKFLPVPTRPMLNYITN